MKKDLAPAEIENVKIHYNLSELEVRSIPAEPKYLRAESELQIQSIPSTGVDRKNAVLRGYVVAMEGPLKSRRGEFDELSLNQMAEVINAKQKGLKSRFTHPSLSHDGLGSFLGRAKDARVETVTDHEGKEKLGLRADLHFDKTALDTPPKGGKALGLYVMDLAESDPDALSSSVVIPYEGLEESHRINEDGTPMKDESGRPLPPLWRISKLHASDIVDSGDAVDGLLSENLPDSAVRMGCDLLDRVFGGQTLDVTRSRALGWLRKYLQLRFGPEAGLPGDEAEELRKEITELQAEKTHLLGVCDELQKRLNKSNEENEVLRVENMRLEVEATFDDELQDKVYPGERPDLLKTGLSLRKSGNHPGSDYRIFIESLKARDKKEIKTKEIAKDAGHHLAVDVLSAESEEKQEVTGFLMP